MKATPIRLDFFDDRFENPDLSTLTEANGTSRLLAGKNLTAAELDDELLASKSEMAHVRFAVEGELFDLVPDSALAEVGNHAKYAEVVMSLSKTPLEARFSVLLPQGGLPGKFWADLVETQAGQTIASLANQFLKMAVEESVAELRTAASAQQVYFGLSALARRLGGLRGDGTSTTDQQAKALKDVVDRALSKFCAAHNVFLNRCAIPLLAWWVPGGYSLESWPT